MAIRMGYKEPSLTVAGDDVSSLVAESESAPDFSTYVLF